ncbi:hypothetical protein BaLi_c10950 [Bacillus paralicheniformis ATCC 9945a]|nr:hypothetical protein BaLi_c10950 [Bacillus paralicheniformis ATCC 9945a]
MSSFVCGFYLPAERGGSDIWKFHDDSEKGSYICPNQQDRKGCRSYKNPETCRLLEHCQDQRTARKSSPGIYGRPTKSFVCFRENRM